MATPADGHGNVLEYQAKQRPASVERLIVGVTCGLAAAVLMASSGFTVWACMLTMTFGGSSARDPLHPIALAAFSAVVAFVEGIIIAVRAFTAGLGRRQSVHRGRRMVVISLVVASWLGVVAGWMILCAADDDDLFLLQVTITVNCCVVAFMLFALAPLAIRKWIRRHEIAERDRPERLREG